MPFLYKVSYSSFCLRWEDPPSHPGKTWGHSISSHHCGIPSSFLTGWFWCFPAFLANHISVLPTDNFLYFIFMQDQAHCTATAFTPVLLRINTPGFLSSIPNLWRAETMACHCGILSAMHDNIGDMIVIENFMWKATFGIDEFDLFGWWTKPRLN